MTLTPVTLAKPGPRPGSLSMVSQLSLACCSRLPYGCAGHLYLKETLEAQKCLVIRAHLALAQPSLSFSMSKAGADHSGISGCPRVTSCEGDIVLASFVQWRLAVCSHGLQVCVEVQGTYCVCACTHGASVAEGQLDHACWQRRSLGCSHRGLTVSVTNIDSVHLERLETVLLKEQSSCWERVHRNGKPGLPPEHRGTDGDWHEPLGHRAQGSCRHGAEAVVGRAVPAGQVAVQSLCSELLQSSRWSKVNFGRICAYGQGTRF